ncbi:MAG: hypothetical protein ACKVS8_10260 [Phycisphaerales bacterium]
MDDRGLGKGRAMNRRGTMLAGGLGLMMAALSASAAPPPALEIAWSAQQVPAPYALVSLRASDSGRLVGSAFSSGVLGGSGPVLMESGTNSLSVDTFSKAGEYADVNEHGMVVGSTRSAGNQVSSASLGLPVQPPFRAELYAVNTAGWVAGRYANSEPDPAKRNKYFRMSPTGEIELLPLITNMIVQGIDAANQIIGTGFDANNDLVPTIYAIDGRIISGTRAGHTGVSIENTSPSGNWCGYFYDGDGGIAQPCISIAGGFRPIPLLPGMNQGVASGVNNAGYAVGMMSNIVNLQTTASKPFVYFDGQTFDLTTIVAPLLLEGESLLIVYDISTNGVVAAAGTRAGETRARVIRLRLEIDGDEDGDGLRDSWETQGKGIDVDGDGDFEVDLFARGARKDHKDAFVEIDGGRNKMLSASAAAKMVAAFAGASVVNPDGTTGIRLHLQRDERNLPMEQVEALIEQEDDPRFSFPFVFDDLREAHFGSDGPGAAASEERALYVQAKRKAYRYALVFDRVSLDGLLGTGELPGDEFWVAFGGDKLNNGVRDADEQAAVFMHELGHTLGLHHGGADDIHGKANYLSIMSYLHALPYDDVSLGTWRLDYSREKFATLVENRLDENPGVSDDPTDPDGDPFFDDAPCFHGYAKDVNGTLTQTLAVARVSGVHGVFPVDWDGDGVSPPEPTLPANLDINFLGVGAPLGIGQNPSPNQTLVGHDDWANLELGLGFDGTFGAIAVKNPGCSNPLNESVIGWTERTIIERLATPERLVCLGDFNGDEEIDEFDLEDAITVYFADPPVPRGPRPCPAAADAPPPFTTDAYRRLGYAAAFSFDGSNLCPRDETQGFPNPDNLGDMITSYFDERCR